LDIRHIENGQMTAGSVDVSYTWSNLLSNIGSALNKNSIYRLGTVLEEGQEKRKKKKKMMKKEEEEEKKRKKHEK
jgi:hypothetical protein